MIWGIIAVLLMLWVVGNVMAFTAKGLIHILLVIAVIMAVINLMSGRKAL